MNQARLDGMSILMLKDKESSEYADYFFMTDVYEPDPRFKSRFMCTGQRRGLFRVHKQEERVELIFPMDMDTNERCFQRAAGKVIQVSRQQGVYPDKEQFVCG
jgi:hypothetical protein